MRVIDDINEIKRIQLSILFAIDRYCRDNGIKYSLDYGTLLGSIRHKGFIPWDDDIDICLLREDYDKLENAFPDILDGKYVFLSLNRDKKWNRPYGVIYDNRTIEIEDSNYNYKGIGIGIDVFPIDEVSDCLSEFNALQRRRVPLAYLLNAKFLKIKKERGIYKNLCLLLIKTALLLFSPRFFACKIESLAKVQRKGGYIYHSSDTEVRLVKSCPKTVFDNYINVSFEGYPMQVMSGFDEYLTVLYGNYMVPPSEGDRGSTHLFRAFWK